MFENVNYTFYTEKLGRAVVPDEETFNRYAFDNIMYVKSFVDDGIIAGERMENGIDAACCFLVEVDYKTRDAAAASESVGGYSVTYDRTGVKSADKQKYEYLNLCCYLKKGVL